MSAAPMLTAPRRRLDAVGAAVTFAVVLIGSLCAHLVISSGGSGQDEDLLAKARRIVSEERVLMRRLQRSDLDVAQAVDGLRVAFISRDADLVVASPLLPADEAIALGSPEAQVANHSSDLSARTVNSSGGRPWRVVAVPSRFGAVVVAQHLARDPSSGALTRGLVLGLGVAPLAAVGTFFGVRRVIRPVRDLAANFAIQSQDARS